MDLLKGLNNKQKEATMLTEGPIIVIAGAGSGKTRVLTHRIAYLVSQGVPIDNILAITFTNKAAKEMKERVEELVGNYNMWISTFHSMCVKILRKHVYLLGYGLNFNILDDDDSVSVIRRIIKDNKIDIELKPRKILNIISNIKNDKPPTGLPFSIQESIDYIYKKYTQYGKEQNVLDFDDLLVKTVELFKSFPEVLKIYQEQFQYILVDEYQDTNDIQNKLIIMLSAIHQNIFLVGDEDQSIYKFRGANYKNLTNFEKYFEETKVILLEQNYRSTQTILSAANDVIENNSTKHKKKLWTDNDDGEKITYFRAITDGDEALYIASEINALIKKGESPEDVTVLYRSNFMSRTIEEGLRILNVPYIVYGGVGYFKRKEVKDVISYLKLIVNNDDNWSFMRVINEPKRGIGPKTVDKILNFANDNGTSMFEICKNADKYFSKTLATKFIDFAETINGLREELDDIDLTDFIDLVTVKTGYKKSLEAQGEEGILRLDNVSELKSVLKGWYLEDYSNLEKLQIILEDISLHTDNDNKVEESVKLMTMHNAKGLEFDYVFIYGVEEGLFPSSRSMDSLEDIEEERRLAYVAITRAKKKVYITNSSARRVYGQALTNPQSRFIDEISDNLIEFKGNRSNSSAPIFKLETKSNEKANSIYKVGDKLKHTTFGVGVVVMIESENVSVAFSAPYGIKKLLSNHHTLTKI
ncbi:3'-5' exonuclease [Mycoplasmatota bacterium WC44]